MTKSKSVARKVKTRTTKSRTIGKTPLSPVVNDVVVDEKKPVNVKGGKHALPVSKAQLPSAIATLQQLYEHQIVGNARAPLISDDNDLVSVSLTVARMPSRTDIGNRFVKFGLPHPIHTLAASTVCVIVTDDMPDDEKRKHAADVDRCARHYQMLFAQHGITGVDLILSNNQLKREYNTHEAKSALAAAYDVFVVDRRVHAQVTKFMGPQFQKKGKYPQFADANDMSKAPASIPAAVGRVTLPIRQFSNIVYVCGAPDNHCRVCSSCKFGRATQTSDELAANAAVVIDRLLDSVYGGYMNVRAISLSHRKFPHLPIYRHDVHASALSDAVLSAINPFYADKTPASTVTDELTCVDDEHIAAVTVTAGGHVKAKTAKGAERRQAVAKFTDAEKYFERARGRTTTAIQRTAVVRAKTDNKGGLTKKQRRDKKMTPAPTTAASPLVKKIKMVTADGEAKKARNKAAKRSK